MPKYKITGLTPEQDVIELYAEGDWEDIADYMECLQAAGAQNVTCVETAEIPFPLDEVMYLTPPQKLYRRDDTEIPQ